MKTLTILAGVMLVFVFVWERVDVVRLGIRSSDRRARRYYWSGSGISCK